MHGGETRPWNVTQFNSEIGLEISIIQVKLSIPESNSYAFFTRLTCQSENKACKGQSAT